MKVVILTTEQGNQVALCNKLSVHHCDIAGVVLSKNVPRRSRPFKQRLAGFVQSRVCASSWPCVSRCLGTHATGILEAVSESAGRTDRQGEQRQRRRDD